jgi:hypothetical protein
MKSDIEEPEEPTDYGGEEADSKLTDAWLALREGNRTLTPELQQELEAIGIPTAEIVAAAEAPPPPKERKGGWKNSGIPYALTAAGRREEAYEKARADRHLVEIMQDKYKPWEEEGGETLSRESQREEKPIRVEPNEKAQGTKKAWWHRPSKMLSRQEDDSKMKTPLEMLQHAVEAVRRAIDENVLANLLADLKAIQTFVLTEGAELTAEEISTVFMAKEILANAMQAIERIGQREKIPSSNLRRRQRVRVDRNR